MQLAAPCRACAVRSLRLRREPLRVAASNCASAKQQQLQRQREQHSSAGVKKSLRLMLGSVACGDDKAQLCRLFRTDMACIVPVSAWMMAAAPLPAFAEDSAAAAAAETLTTPSWLGYALLLSPIVLYAIFNLYRSQVNPRYVNCRAVCCCVIPGPNQRLDQPP